MADNTSLSNITSELTSSLWENAPFQLTSGISFLIGLGKAIGIVFLIYLGFLIIKSIINIRQALRTKSIEQNVKEINSKLDILIGKHHKEKEEKKK